MVLLKIWIDISNAPHVRFFKDVIKHLQDEGEDVIITFEKEYVSADGDSTTRTVGIQNVGGKILSWNISGGGQPSEDVYAFGGKTFNFQKPREKFTAGFEVIINNADFDFVQFGGASGARIGSAAGKTIKSTDTTRRWRVIMWFQEKAYHVTNSTKTVTVPFVHLLCDTISAIEDVTFTMSSSPLVVNFSCFVKTVNVFMLLKITIANSL